MAARPSPFSFRAKWSLTASRTWRRVANRESSIPPGRFRSWTLKPPLAGAAPRLNGEKAELRWPGPAEKLGGGGAQQYGGEGGAEVAGPRVDVRLGRHADVGRQIIPRAELVRDDAPHA